MLAIAFGTMLVVYSLVAGLGYYYFGRDAATLVTSDLATDTPFAGKSILIPGFTVANFMAGCVLLNAYTTYPSLLLVIQVCSCNLMLPAAYADSQWHSLIHSVTSV